LLHELVPGRYACEPLVSRREGPKNTTPRLFFLLRLLLLLLLLLLPTPFVARRQRTALSLSWIFLQE
jgi:hypothetical protein